MFSGIFLCVTAWQDSNPQPSDREPILQSVLCFDVNNQKVKCTETLHIQVVPIRFKFYYQ